jgi:hypothetical protein
MTRSRERLHDDLERRPNFRPRRQNWWFVAAGALGIYALTRLFR